MNKIIYLSFLVLLLISCKSKKNIQVADTPEKFCLDSLTKQKILIENPEIRKIAEGIHLTGSIEVNPDKVVRFINLTNGIVANVYFSLGDKVTKGQLLAEIRTTELSGYESDLKNLSAQKKVAEGKLKSVQSMYDDGISSKKELLEAQSELEIIRSQEQRILSNMNLFGAQTNKGVFQIKAPASGIITDKNITQGMQITEGDNLFTVADLGNVWAMINIYDTDIKDIHEGMKVEIKTLVYPDKIFNGIIASISQVYDEEARVLKAKVVLPNAAMNFKPGMLIDAEALKLRNEDAISVTADAVIFDDNQHFLVIYKSDCDFEIRKVDILYANNNTVYIADGLKIEDKVVSKNAILIYEQLKNF